jgi:hypothetical protein
MQDLLNILLILVKRFENATFELSAQFLEKPLDGVDPDAGLYCPKAWLSSRKPAWTARLLKAPKRDE